MKKAIRFLVVAGIMTASLIGLNGCGDASKKHMADANANMEEAGQDIAKAVEAADQEAIKKTTIDWQQFKTDYDSTIAVMEMQIQKIKGSIAKADKKNREKLTSDLNKAEAKLNEQKEKLRQRDLAFEADVKKLDASVAANNEAFKMEFKHDMDDLGTALTNLFKDNVK